MKFIAIRSNIKDALGVVEKMVGENSNLPILKNILITTEGGTISFTATNLEIATTHKVPGKVIEEGKMTAPAGLLSGLIGNLQSDRLNFEKKGNDLEVSTDNYNATLRGLPAEDFPITPKIKGQEEHLDIKGVFLREAIQQVVVAAQFSDLRPELNSVLFDFTLDSLKLAATDGFRLSEKALAASLFSTKSKEPFKILLPLKTAQELSRIIRDEDTVRLVRDENQVLIKTERTELISRLMEGGFPDYSAIVPRDFACEVVVKRDELANALKLAGVFGQKNSEVRIAVHAGKKAIEVSSADQALGENTNLLAAKVKGEAVAAHFNWRYLADPLKVIKSEDVFLGLQADTGPALLRGANDGSYFYIVKPILKG